MQDYLHGREPSLPHTINLADGQTLELLQWLRVLPNQRYVAHARWQGKAVLAKLLVGKKVNKYYHQELLGAQLLAAQQISTPPLLAYQQEQKFSWLLFDFLEQSTELAEQYYKVDETERLNLLRPALSLIAQLHKKGLYQADLHLDNFLVSKGKLYVIDGGGIKKQHSGKTINSKIATHNLAVFIAQLPRITDQFLTVLMTIYQDNNKTVTIQQDQLKQAVNKVRHWRLKDYLNKTARDCSLFSLQKDPNQLQVIKRSLINDVNPLIKQADAFIEQGHIYKTGGAATVAKSQWQNKTWIIKRYNIKNIRHWLKRCWRPSRAWHSWQAGHMLNLLNIAVALPVAVKEKRFFGLRSVAWLITEYCGEEDLISHFDAYVTTGAVPQSELEQLKALLNALIQEKVSHGDMKGHNILWHDGQFVLIDLDAVKKHRSTRAFRKEFKKDRTRLLRNWPKDSALYKKLDQTLPNL